MPRRWRHWRCLVAILAALSLGTCVADAQLAALHVELRADPDRVPADGESQSVISVEVTDATGRPAPDGTLVYLVTTLGDIVSPVQTVGGFAQTTLTASNAAGTALVSAVVGAARRTVEVVLVGEPGSAAPGSRLVTLSGDEVRYSADQRTCVVSGTAELTYRDIVIEAEGLQYDMYFNVVCAQGNVVLRSGRHEVRADALRYELLDLRGRLLRVSQQAKPVERLIIEGDRLQARPDESEEACLWEPLETGESGTWAKADRVVIDPGKKVILDHATFYVDGTRVMSLRRHVLDPRLGSAVFGDSLGFSSAGGVDLDLPVYYRASAQRVGSLHVTRNRRLWGTQYEPGWSLGLREEYMQQGGTEGAFTFDDITDLARGMGWEHQQRFGRGARLNLDASAVSFEDEGPRFRSGRANLFLPVSGGGLSLAVSGSDIGSSEHRFAELSYRLDSRGVGGGVLATPTLYVRQSRSHSEQEAVMVDPDTGEPFRILQQRSGGATSPGAEVSFKLPSRRLSAGTRLLAGLTTGYAWGLAGGAAGMLDGRLRLQRDFSAQASASLSYTYSSRPAGIDEVVFAGGRQTLGLTAHTPLGPWSTRLNFSADLDGDRRFGSVDMRRPLPFGSDVLGRPLWHLEVHHFFSSLDIYSFANTRFTLSRVMGRYRAAVCYSPQGVGDFGSRPWATPVGYGYTYAGGRHLWVELSASAY